MGLLLEPCAFRAAQEPQDAQWQAALPAKAFRGIASSAQMANS